MAAVLIMFTYVPAIQAATTSCPDAIPSAGFVDLIGFSAETVDAIDCVAHFGITEGVAPTQFSPSASVPRWQMALFMVRTAKVIGMSVPDGSGVQFTDIGGLPADVQLAIRQLGQLGITTGVGTGLFAPHQLVSRWQMAVFISRLLSLIGIVSSGVPLPFTDLGGLSSETLSAVSLLVGRGIATGTTPTTFAPHDAVSRWHLALMLARTLNSVGARSVTLSISLTTTTVPVVGSTIATVVAAKPDGTPFAGLLVDVFVGSATGAGNTCLLDADASINGGDAGTSTNCTVDVADLRTNSAGQITFGLTHSSLAELDTIWAWVGSTGAVFDADTSFDRVTATVTWTPTADGLIMSPDVSLPFGSTTKASAQLTGAASAVAGQTVVFSVRRAGILILTQTLTTDASGLAQLSYVGPADPTTGDDPPVEDEVSAFWDRNGDGIDNGDAEFDGLATVTWDEL